MIRLNDIHLNKTVLPILAGCVCILLAGVLLFVMPQPTANAAPPWAMRTPNTFSMTLVLPPTVQVNQVITIAWQVEIGNETVRDVRIGGYQPDNTNIQPVIHMAPSGSMPFTPTMSGLYTFTLQARGTNNTTSAIITRSVTVTSQQAIFIPVIFSDYPPTWKRSAGTAGHIFRTPTGCPDGRWYAGTNESGVWKSKSGNDNWAPAFGLTGRIRPVVVDPNNCDQVFLATWEAGVYRVTDNIAAPNAPQTINSGLDELQLYGLALNGNTLYVGTNTTGVYKTDFNAIGWQNISAGMSDQRIRSLTVYDGEIYAGARGCTLFTSADAGNTWATEQILSSTACPNDAQVWSTLRIGTLTLVGLGNNAGLYLKSDGSANWQQVTDIPAATIYGLVYDEANQALYVSAYGQGVYRCSNTLPPICEPYNTGLLTLNTREIAIHGNRMVVGSDDGLWYRAIEAVQ